jgi:class 3 adenylate cyclase
MTCPRCQHQNRSGAKFCEECGTSLAPAASAEIPGHLAERILTSKAALEGERKQVTVLFADMKGSMELIADRDPETARKILDPVLQLMMDAVHRYEGTVNQVMGDGIMALFGAQLAHEDHAVRACYAALRIQDAIRRHTDEMRRAHGVEVRVRVGLNSGEVVVRAIGSDLRMDYTAVGPTTHLAARMEQLAPPGAIRITADTYRLAEGFVQVDDLGPVPVRGIEAPVEVYELVGVGPVRTRLQAAAVRGLSHFVGRDVERAAAPRARTGAERSRPGGGRGGRSPSNPGSAWPARWPDASRTRSPCSAGRRPRSPTRRRAFPPRGSSASARRAGWPAGWTMPEPTPSRVSIWPARWANGVLRPAPCGSWAMRAPRATAPTWSDPSAASRTR